MLSKNLKLNKGFTLLEVIGAIFVISVGVAGVINIVPQIISNTTLNTSKLTAAYLTQEGVEIVRNVRDGNWLEAHNRGDSTSWSEGLLNCGSGCEADYFCTTIEDPIPSDPAGHNCFELYGAGNILKFSSDDGYNYLTGSDTRFKRKITITQEGTDALVVTVEVSWNEKGKSYKISSQEKLYQWF